jgi:signal transduction histidine kinase
MRQLGWISGNRRRLSFRALHQGLKLHVGADPERLISTGRLVSALFASLAIYLDPTRPARSLDEVHLVLGAYVAFSLSLTLFPTRKPVNHPIHLLIHGADVLALATLVYLTDELDSPFFPFVPYILLATTMRWGMRGAVLGAIAMEIMMIAVGWQDLIDGDSELNLVIMRSAYFLVAAVMLGYFGAYRARSSQRFAQLASWSAAPATMEDDVWLHDLMDHASRLLGASWLLLIWNDGYETCPHAAMLGSEGLRRADLPVLADLDGKGDREILNVLARTTGWPLSDSDNMCAAPFAGMRNAGRLYVFDAHYRHEDAASLASITALRIGHELERFALTRAIAESARDQERIRLARDLHDSVLQDLTAATLKLKAATTTAPPALRQSFQAVSALLTAQQRRIRLFVEDSRKQPDIHYLSASLSHKVMELSDQWGCDIDLTVTPPDMVVPAIIHRELAQLLSEATANAVRHGGATRLEVELCRIDHGLSLCIADNGGGIAPGDGCDPLAPRSVRARVDDLNGSLAITRYTPGLALRIEIPLP